MKQILEIFLIVVAIILTIIALYCGAAEVILSGFGG